MTSRKKGLAPEFFVHESAYVDDGVTIGTGTKIWHYSHILRNCVIGEGCTIGQNVSIGPDASIGDRCKIQNNVSVFKGVTLEAEVFCGPSCVFTNVYNPRAFIERKHEFRETLVKQGATIGANATILCGNTIGRYAMVAAGAVVTAHVPDYALVAGVPALRKGWVCRCGTTLEFTFAPLADSSTGVPATDDYMAPVTTGEEVKCRACGKGYFLADGRLLPLDEE